MSLIIVEIPHSRPAEVWIADTEEVIINMAMDTQNMFYSVWTMKNALERWCNREDIPTELLELLAVEEKVVEFSYGYDNDPEYFSINQAPSEFEAAKEALFHDLSSGFVLTEEEALRFISEDSKHYDVKVRDAVRQVL